MIFPPQWSNYLFVHVFSAVPNRLDYEIDNCVRRPNDVGMNLFHLVLPMKAAIGLLLFV